MNVLFNVLNKFMLVVKRMGKESMFIIFILIVLLERVKSVILLVVLKFSLKRKFIG